MSEIRPDAIDIELDEKPMPRRVTLPRDVPAWGMPIVGSSKPEPRRDSYRSAHGAFDLEND